MQGDPHGSGLTMHVPRFVVLPLALALIVHDCDTRGGMKGRDPAGSLPRLQAQARAQGDLLRIVPWDVSKRAWSCVFYLFLKDLIIFF